jgi:hypothetical protein
MVYGLHAKGESTVGWPFEIWHKCIYDNEDLAKDHIPEFIEACCDPKYILNCAKRETLEIKIVTFEFVVSSK